MPIPGQSQQKSKEEFPEFSKQGISNLLMFHGNFESLDGTFYISSVPPSRRWRLRWGRVVAQIPLDHLCRSHFQSISPESGKGSSERESRFFRSQFLVRRNGRKSNCLNRRRRRVLDLQWSRALELSKKDFGAAKSAPFPLSSDKSREKGFRNGPGNANTLLLQTCLRDMSGHKTEEILHWQETC